MATDYPVWVNGRQSETIAVTDRGLAYGDGIFETIKVSAGQLMLEELHWQRLAKGAARLGIQLDLVAVREESLEFLNSAKAKDAILKIIVTRGSGGRGYNAQNVSPASRVMSLHPLPVYPREYYENGIAVRLCDLRLGQSALAGIKHLNRLEQVMARAEWCDSRYQEGILLDVTGHVIEGIMTNLFLVDSHSNLITPCLKTSGVDGVCRQYILKNAHDWHQQVYVTKVSLDMLAKAQEVFVTNSVNGVWPVVVCDQYQWSVGNVTQMIQNRVADVLNG